MLLDFANAYATFCMLMNDVMAGLVPEEYLAYLEDIAIHWKSLRNHTKMSPNRVGEMQTNCHLANTHLNRSTILISRAEF